MKTRTKTHLLLFLTGAGFFISLYQTYHFFLIRSGMAGFKSVCSVGPFDCETVELSRFAELIPGIPLSSFAMGWYLAFFITLFFLKNRAWEREAGRVVFGFSSVAAILSTFYLIIMATVLKSFCLFCLIIDFINWASLVIAWNLKPSAGADTAANRPQLKTFGWITVGCLVFGLILGKMMDPLSNNASSKELKYIADSVTQRVPLELGITQAITSIGPENAPITIVKFSDFQCPHCKVGAQSIHPLFKKYPGKIRLILQNFPLSSDCHPMVNNRMHPASCGAAKAVICAAKQGKFEEVYTSLFEHQAQLTPENVTTFAVEAGANADHLNACMTSDETSKILVDQIQKGISLNIRSTPTFFINGRLLEGGVPTQIWSEIIDKLLK